jgi:aryl carrier-like protein
MTSEQYKKRLDKLANAQNDHPLLNILRGGHSAMNELYLNAALEDLKTTKLTATEPTVTVEKEAYAPELYRDETFAKMVREKIHLRNQIRKTSNEFHEVKTDAEARLVSIRVLDLEKQWRCKKADIDYYEKNRRLPDKLDPHTEGDDWTMPKDPVQRQKALLSARSNVCIAEREILTLPLEVRDNPTHTQYARWQRLENRRKIWLTRKKLIENVEEEENLYE